jgi:hypothetical protein
LLLEAWNTFDDVSHTVNKSIMPIGLFSKKEVDKLYEKIFYGNNLEPVTPEEKYFPVLVAKEQKIIRTLFNEAAKELSLIIGYELW